MNIEAKIINKMVENECKNTSKTMTLSGKYVWKEELSDAGWEYKLVQPLWESVWRLLRTFHDNHYSQDIENAYCMKMPVMYVSCLSTLWIQ